MNMDKTSMLLTDASFKWLRTHQEVCVIEAISNQCVLVMSKAVFLQPLPDTQNPPRVYQTATDVDAYIQKYWNMKINKNILIIPHYWFTFFFFLNNKIHVFYIHM